MNTFGLKKAIGMPFTYKQKFQGFLEYAKNSFFLNNLLSTSEKQALAKYTNNFKLCTPAMGYSSKLYAYQCLEVITKALISSNNTSSQNKEKLNQFLLSILKFVGIEGDTDFHFQIETFKAVEFIYELTALGPIFKFRVYNGGSGYETQLGDTQNDLPVLLESVGSIDANAEVNLVNGSIVLGEYTIVGGDGDLFRVGQIVTIESTDSPSLTYTAVAQAIVTEIL